VLAGLLALQVGVLVLLVLVMAVMEVIQYFLPPHLQVVAAAVRVIHAMV